MIKTLVKFYREKSAAVAISFGMMVPMLVSAVGMSVDIGQTYLVRERLSQALDAAALAAASTASDNPQHVEDRVNDFLAANYPPDKVGFTTSVHVENNDDVLMVEATAQLNTSFMRVFGEDFETVEVFAETEVTKEVKAIEVALVMDVTGSMSTNNNIKTLRTAATNFVNTMFSRVDDTNMIKIGLVPFAQSVNVGPYGLGKTPGNKTYDTAFMNNPSNLTYSKTDTSKWMGCVLEGNYPKDTQDHTGKWDMYRYCRTSTGTVINNCDTTYDKKTKKYTANQHQNYMCPSTPLTPLTNNKTELLNSIATLTANGNTYINTGLVWGYRLISPSYPFKEGVSWTNEDWQKAIILMTDGVNTMHPYYSIYGPTASHNIDANDLDDRMLDVCDELKAKNVLVYTITFDDGVDNYTKGLFESCATQPSMWYDAPTQAKLIEVYQKIARELANLHISK